MGLLKDKQNIFIFFTEILWHTYLDQTINEPKFTFLSMLEYSEINIYF